MRKSILARIFASKGKAVAVAGLSLVLVATVVTGGVLLARNSDQGKLEQPQSSGVFTPDLDPDAGTNSPPVQQAQSTEIKEIRIPGYPSITLPKDQKSVEVYFLNPEGNPCYFTFELVLTSTGESLYTSKMVPPGQAITNMKMSRSLPEGTYEAVLKISTVSLEDGSPMNGADMKTTLIVG